MVPGSFSVHFTGNHFDSPLSFYVYRSFFDALALKHSLPPAILQMQGMSGQRYRMFVNNLVRLMGKARYLEVGSWLGSTACSAMWGNTAQVTCIDNWTRSGGPKDAFLKNTEITKSNCDLRFIESDFRLVDFSALGPCNVYLFDGPHEEADQYDGVTYAYSALAEEFVLIVDDFNWKAVRSGTRRAANDLNLLEVFSIEIRTSQDDSQPVDFFMENSDWHNGYYIGVFRKIPSTPKGNPPLFQGAQK